MTQTEIKALADETARKALVSMGDRVTERHWLLALETAEFVLDLLINPAPPPPIAGKE